MTAEPPVDDPERGAAHLPPPASSCREMHSLDTPLDADPLTDYAVAIEARARRWSASCPEIFDARRPA